MSCEATDDDLHRAAERWRWNGPVRIQMGREGKSCFVAQGMSTLAWIPEGAGDARPPRLPPQRLKMAKKLGQRFIKYIPGPRGYPGGGNVPSGGHGGMVAVPLAPNDPR